MSAEQVNMYQRASRLKPQIRVLGQIQQGTADRSAKPGFPLFVRLNEYEGLCFFAGVLEHRLEEFKVFRERLLHLILQGDGNLPRLRQAVARSF